MKDFHIFNDIQNKKADFILNNQYAKLSGLISKEIQELAITGATIPLTLRAIHIHILKPIFSLKTASHPKRDMKMPR